MVTEIDDVGRGLARFKAKDVPVVYGPGRHPASTSVFLYFLDPDGMTLEYSFGMEQFPERRSRGRRASRPDAAQLRLLGLLPRSAHVGRWRDRTSTRPDEAR